jgi:parallel beta-helix repeat protein
VRTEWTGGPLETNGSYGLYPVQCKNVLIEDSVVIGASDAGIYVGQSSQIVVRRNRVQSNVAGIEIENSTGADVYENRATGNTGGILVFNLPDLPVRDGRQVRVFDNQIIENNLPNFAPKGNLVAKVPAGTGVMVMAASQVQIFKNVIQNNATSNVSVISYLVTGNPIKDKSYYPYTEGVYVHGNSISGGGVKPDGELAAKFTGATKKPMADIVYDGIINAEKIAGGTLPAELRFCLGDNGGATFINLDAGRGFQGASSDLRPFKCALPDLSPVRLPGL